MEWVETTGRTVEEAKDRALDQLGVDEQEAEFEVLEEPRAGLFGRLRGGARVRARVRPAHPRPKVDRRERRRRRDDRGAPDRPTTSDTGAAHSERPRSSKTRARTRTTPAPKGSPVDNDHTSAPSGVETTTETTAERRESEVTSAPAPAVDPAQLAGDATAFVEAVLAAFGLEATVAAEVSEDAVELDVQGEGVGVLIGPRGQTMTALQDLTRMAVQRRVGPDAPRLSVDVGSYRQRRHEALRRFAERVAEEVLATGETRMLEPMSAVDRKVVHDAINDIDGVATSSDGEEPHRRVVVSPVA
jgi:spoIIIJ-associated protein